MKKSLLIFMGALALTIHLVGIGGADNGPHGNYTATTDTCAACHRAHTALGESLLTSASTATDRSAFCYSCHVGGFGAYTDVKHGYYIADPPVDYDTTNAAVLKGGAFETMRMNPGITGSLHLAVTSNHTINAGSNTVWGYGGMTTTVYAGPIGVSLTCTNCHNPHGKAGAGNTATYRILKGNNPNNSPLFANGLITQSVGYDVPDSGFRTYLLVNAGGDNYFNQHHSEATNDVKYAYLTAWCAKCHTRYHAVFTSNPGQMDSGDVTYRFRHPMNDTSIPNDCWSCHWGNRWPPYPGCMTCHVAHGTAARMGPYSGSVPWPGGGSTPNGNARSALLRLDNRGVCEQCHEK